MENSFYSGTATVQCCEEILLLHPQKVIYWPARKTLFAADIHAGKEQTFARSGIPIPGGISEDTFTLLMQLVDNFGAERLIILGDLLHSTPVPDENWQQHLTQLLNARTQLNLQVIIGNHDSLQARGNTLKALVWKTEIHDPPFVYKHEPEPHDNGYVLAGHIHPAWQLTAGRRNRLKSPVFWFQQQVAVLPAFGLFTGGHLIQRTSVDRVFMIGTDCVMEV